MARETGMLIVLIGIVVVLVGLFVSTGGLSWFGRLPGDIRIEREHTKIYVPLVSMLLVSVGISLLLALLQRMR